FHVTGVQTCALPIFRDCLALPAWDDRAALAALAGNAEAMRQLRKLFLAELPDQVRQLRACLDADDIAAARAVLHRLKGSCGFVGAAALHRAARALHDNPQDPPYRPAYRRHAGAPADPLPAPPWGLRPCRPTAPPA